MKILDTPQKKVVPQKNAKTIPRVKNARQNFQFQSIATSVAFAPVYLAMVITVPPKGEIMKEAALPTARLIAIVN